MQFETHDQILKSFELCELKIVIEKPKITKSLEVIPDKLNKLIEDKPCFSSMEIPSDSFQKKNNQNKEKVHQDDKKPVFSIAMPAASFQKKNDHEIHQSDKKQKQVEKNDPEIQNDDKMFLFLK